MHPSVRLGAVQWAIEAFIERNLLGKGEFATAADLPVQTETAAIVGAPLTIAAVWAEVFLGGVFSHGAVGVCYFSTSAMAALTACSLI